MNLDFLGSSWMNLDFSRMIYFLILLMMMLRTSRRIYPSWWPCTSSWGPHNTAFKGLFSCHERFGLEKRLQYWITTSLLIHREGTNEKSERRGHCQQDDSMIITGGLLYHYYQFQEFYQTDPTFSQGFVNAMHGSAWNFYFTAIPCNNIMIAST